MPGQTRVPALASTAALALAPSLARAHGFGQRFDLPLPLYLWVGSAGGTIVATFILTAIFVRDTQERRAYPRLNLLTIDMTRGSLGGLFVGALRNGVAGFFILSLAAGLFGNQDPYHNLAPTVVWVIWWVGVTYVCALVGNIWGLANPFETVFRGLEAIYSALSRGRSLSFNAPYPAALGAWPAVVVFAGFTWAELIWTEKDVPRALARAALCYSAFTWAAMLVWGHTWLRRAEAFSLMFNLFGRFAPVEGEWRGGEHPSLAIRVRSIGVGLLEQGAVTTSFLVFVMAMLSSVTFDGFLETPLFQDLLTAVYASPGLEEPLLRLSEFSGLEEGALVSSALLIGAIGLFTAALYLTSLLMRWIVRAASGESRAITVSAIARSFLLSLVPIAIAYHLAHYLSLLLTAGQFIIPLSSDPFGLGWNLFRTADYQVNLGIVGPRFFWYASITAILVGHMVSVYLSHTVAVRMFGARRTALLSQLPMVALMVAYTMISLWILAQPVVS